MAYIGPEGAWEMPYCELRLEAIVPSLGQFGVYHGVRCSQILLVLCLWPFSYRYISNQFWAHHMLDMTPFDGSCNASWD